MYVIDKQQILLSPIHTNFVPQLSALVGDRNSLRAPQRQPGVGKKLLRDKCQHAYTVAVTSVQHLANLRQRRRTK